MPRAAVWLFERALVAVEEGVDSLLGTVRPSRSLNDIYRVEERRRRVVEPVAIILATLLGRVHCILVAVALLIKVGVEVEEATTVVVEAAIRPM